MQVGQAERIRREVVYYQTYWSVLLCLSEAQAEDCRPYTLLSEAIERAFNGLF